MFKRILPRTFWLIGISLAVILLCLGLFRFWIPNQEEARRLRTNTNEYVAEANKIDAAIKKKNAAIASIRAAEAAWLPHEVDHTPPASLARGGIDLNVNPMKLLIDTKTFRNSMQRKINAQVQRGGVEVIEGPWVEGVTDQDDPNAVLATYYNYPTLPFPVVIYDLGQVKVRGTFNQIAANVRAWRYAKEFIAVAHGLALSGTTGTANGQRKLTGTYNVSVIVPMRYSGFYPQIPLGASGAALAGGPGAGAPTGGQPPLGRPGGGGPPNLNVPSGGGPPTPPANVPGGGGQAPPARG